LLALDRQYLDRIVVHGHAELAFSHGLAGWHGPVPPDSPKLAGRVSFSSHSFNELNNCAPCPSAFIGPVFDSHSKIGYHAAMDVQSWRHGVKGWKSAPNRQVEQLYALGGVDVERLPSVVDMGFDGAAVLGAVWNTFDPLTAWDDLHLERQRVIGLVPQKMPPIASWREELQKRRVGEGI
ncbi:MAG TPA: thiamine phosphate synthase, partial [Fibrobacteraceae bacterium]|nr:thiamine phosphate synthase [Fibrobacteraceae bacterium]